MGLLSHLFYPWGLLLQVAAVIHFFRRQPDRWWFWVIVFMGPPGALIYIFVEVIPDAGLLRGTFQAFPRRQHIARLETAIRDNPSAANFEELGLLYMDDGKLAQAREAFDRAIGARSDTLDSFYRRGVCALLLGDAAGALPDLERTVAKDADYDFRRAGGLLARAYALTGQTAKAEALFRQVLVTSTRSETYLHFAEFLASQGNNAEAREWAQKVLAKKPTMPGYLRRRERSWFRAASALLKRLRG